MIVWEWLQLVLCPAILLGAPRRCSVDSNRPIRIDQGRTITDTMYPYNCIKLATILMTCIGVYICYISRNLRQDRRTIKLTNKQTDRQTNHMAEQSKVTSIHLFGFILNEVAYYNVYSNLLILTITVTK